MVSEDGHKVAGIISERDIIQALAKSGPDLLTSGRRVAELMEHNVITCTPDDTVQQVMAEMTRRRVRHLPVIEDGGLVGIISIGDVVKSRLEEVELEANVPARHTRGATSRAWPRSRTPDERPTCSDLLQQAGRATDRAPGSCSFYGHDHATQWAELGDAMVAQRCIAGAPFRVDTARLPGRSGPAKGKAAVLGRAV